MCIGQTRLAPYLIRASFQEFDGHVLSIMLVSSELNKAESTWAIGHAFLRLLRKRFE